MYESTNRLHGSTKRSVKSVGMSMAVNIMVVVVVVIVVVVVGS